MKTDSLSKSFLDELRFKIIGTDFIKVKEFQEYKYILTHREGWRVLCQTYWKALEYIENK